MSHKLDVCAGDVFDRLTVIMPRAEIKNASYLHLCRCECGTEKLIGSSNLSLGKTKSCGCLAREVTSSRVRTHGMSKGPEYQVWNRMWSRCTNPLVDRYPRYGGRGITVCQEWESFEIFYNDMGARPSEGHSIGRIDNDGNYCKENCRWETAAEQSSNTSRSVFLEHNGCRLTIAQWALNLGIPADVIRQRVYAGMSPERALERESLVKKAIEVDGVVMLTTEWMKHLAIPISTFYKLKRDGISPEEIVRRYLKRGEAA